MYYHSITNKYNNTREGGEGCRKGRDLERQIIEKVNQSVSLQQHPLISLNPLTYKTQHNIIPEVGVAILYGRG